MRKGLLVLLLVLFLVPISLATQTKLNTMGYYAPYYMVDDYNIQYWPQLVTQYPNLLVYEHPYAGGITWKLGANDVVGLFISDYYYNIPGWSNEWSYPQDKFGLIYGHKFETFKLGFAFNWADDKFKYEDGYTWEEKASMMAFKGGFSMDFGEGHSFDLAATYSKTSFKVDDDGDEVVSSDAGGAFDFLARLNYQFNEKTRLVPALEFTSSKIGYRDDGAGYMDTTDYSYSLFGFGIGCNHKPNDKIELINAIGIEIEKYTYDYRMYDEKETYTYTYMPYFNLGANINVKSWLDFRFGLTKWLGSEKYEYSDVGTDVYNYSENYFDYMVGVGIKVAGLEFDCALDNDYFFGGPYFLSGENEGEMFNSISIKYQF